METILRRVLVSVVLPNHMKFIHTPQALIVLHVWRRLILLINRSTVPWVSTAPEII